MNPFRFYVGSFIALLCAGALIHQTIVALLNTPQFQHTSERSQYDKWLRESRIHAATARAILSERMRSFDSRLNKIETRSEMIISLQEYAGSDELYEALIYPLEDNDSFLPTPLDDEADIRVSRIEIRNSPTTDIGLRGREARLLIEQERTLDEIIDRASMQSESIRTLLKETNVSLTTSLNQATMIDDVIMLEEMGVVLREAQVEEGFITKTQEAMARIIELKRYQDILRSAPLSSPLQVEYRFTSGFGTRIDPFTFQFKNHHGLDLVAFFRAPVYATAPGRIIFAGVKNGYGNCVYIDHGNGFQTRYAHLQDINVRIGQIVENGDQIGTMGSTGRSTGTHLHYEIWLHGRPVNPMPFITTGRRIYA